MSNHSGSPPMPFIRVKGDSPDGYAHGGRDLPPPPNTNRRVQVRKTDHPSTDRWVYLTTTTLNPTPIYRLGVVDGFGTYTTPPQDFPTLRKARNAASRLLTTELENDE